LNTEIMTTGILLAAGFSRRFGPEDKLMQRLPDGRFIAEAAAQHLIEAIPQCVAVVRNGNEVLAKRLEQLGFHVVICPSAALNKDAADMADSLKTALRYAVQLPELKGHEGFVIALADMPYIKPETIRLVCEQMHEAAIAIPVHQGKRGHPVGFSKRFLPALLALDGDEGARSIIRRHEDEVSFLTVDDAGILVDIDTPQDLKRF
jgi:molybdenum cofactor cytidylyltransferase